MILARELKFKLILSLFIFHVYKFDVGLITQCKLGIPTEFKVLCRFESKVLRPCRVFKNNLYVACLCLIQGAMCEYI